MEPLYCYHLLPACLEPLDERPAALLGRAAHTLVQGFVTHPAYVALATRQRPGPGSEARLRLLCALDLNPAAALLPDRSGTDFRERWNAYNRLAPLGVNSQLDAGGGMRRQAPRPVDAALRQATRQSAPTRAEVAALCAQALAMRDPQRTRSLGELAARLGSPAWLRELLALLHEAAEPGLSLAQAGARLGRSPRQLQRDLAQASLGFATLRQAVRLERAQALLQDPTIELTEVAHAAGFFDSAHFNHCWWRACGLAPSQYRALLRLDTRPEVNH